jgi:protein-arginine kinase activator protein McsA
VELERAVRREEYERAASLRDAIREREETLRGGKDRP